MSSTVGLSSTFTVSIHPISEYASETGSDRIMLHHHHHSEHHLDEPLGVAGWVQDAVRYMNILMAKLTLFCKTNGATVRLEITQFCMFYIKMLLIVEKMQLPC